MMFRRGSAVVATLATTILGIGASSAVTYSVLTGRSLCSVIHGCDGEKATAATAATPTTVPAANTTSETKPCCPLMAAMASASGCSKSGSGCCKSGASVAQGVVSLNAAYPIVVPATFYSEKSCCPSTLVLAAASTTTASTSSCCKGSKAAMIAATAAKASGCCKGDQAACGSKLTNGVVAASSAYPVMIPAAFYSETQVCPTTLVKAASCAASSSSCPMNDPGCCKGTGVRADGKPCCGKCTKAQTADTTGATPVASKPAGTN